MERERGDGVPGTSSLTLDAIARYRAEVEEHSSAVAARFGRLMEMEVERISEIVPAEPDSLLERAEAAIRQLKRFPHARSAGPRRSEDS